MSNMELVLRDGTEIEINDATYGGHYITVCANMMEYFQQYTAMSDENMSSVQVKKDDEVIQIIEGMRVINTQSVRNPDNTLTCHYYTTGGVPVVPGGGEEDEEGLEE